jgi:hypothetical protein
MTKPSPFLPVGYVSRKEEDPLPSTGPHLDVRVFDPKTNKYLNPSTIRSLLTRLKVGPNYTPLWKQKGNEWVSSYPITSGFGYRDAPTYGASSYHPAHDYGVGAGTQLAWEGPGTFKPGKGYGEIQTTDAQGRPFVVKLLHTRGGKEGSVAGQPVAQTPSAPAGTTTSPLRLIENYFIGGLPGQERERDPFGFLSNYRRRLNIQDLLSVAQPQSKVSGIGEILSQQPEFYG